MPGVALRRVLRIELDAHLQDRPAEPGAKALPEECQDLAVGIENSALAHDFSERWSCGGDLHLFNHHRASRVEHELLADAIDARAVIAQGAQAAGVQVDLRLEEFIAHGLLIRKPHARAWCRSARVAIAWNPGKSQGRHFHNQPGLVAVQLKGLERLRERERSTDAIEFQGHAARKAAGVQQQITGHVRRGTCLQALRQRQGSFFFDYSQLRSRIGTCFLGVILGDRETLIQA